VRVAGIWESWVGPDGVVESAAILTTAANELVGQLHDRMPVILSAERFEMWLDPKEQVVEELLPMLQRCPDERMECWAVSTRVNSVKGGNDAGLIERV
jgi:putative SOS response-associated peptidase YedK